MRYFSRKFCIIGHEVCVFSVRSLHIRVKKIYTHIYILHIYMYVWYVFECPWYNTLHHSVLFWFLSVFPFPLRSSSSSSCSSLPSFPLKFLYIHVAVVVRTSSWIRAPSSIWVWRANITVFYFAYYSLHLNWL